MLMNKFCHSFINNSLAAMEGGRLCLVRVVHKAWFIKSNAFAYFSILKIAYDTQHKSKHYLIKHYNIKVSRY